MKPARRRARARGPALRPVAILQAADHACYLCGGRFDALTLDHSSRSPEAARTQDGTCCRHVSPATPARTTGCCRNWTSCPPGLPTTRGCGSCSRPASSGHPTWRMTSSRNAWVSSVWTARLLASGMRRPAQDQDMDDEHAGVFTVNSRDPTDQRLRLRAGPVSSSKRRRVVSSGSASSSLRWLVRRWNTPRSSSVRPMAAFRRMRRRYSSSA